MGGVVLRFPKRGHSAASTKDGAGRGMSAGQSASGQWSENHCIVLSSRRTLMPAPASMAAIFLPSLKARELTVDKATPSASAYARATESSCSMPFMPTLSVNIPGKSTAKLPGALPGNPGHSTDMDIGDLLQRIEQRLDVLKLSADDAARQAGVPDAIRNIRRAVDKGKGGPTARTLAALAKVLQTTPAWLMGSQEPINGLDLDHLLQKRETLLDEVARVQLAIKEQQKPPPRKPRNAKA